MILGYCISFAFWVLTQFTGPGNMIWDFMKLRFLYYDISKLVSSKDHSGNVIWIQTSCVPFVLLYIYVIEMHILSSHIVQRQSWILIALDYLCQLSSWSAVVMLIGNTVKV